ncbi:STAS domain-containing protein [Streptomyces sp. TRM66268-LWL]|uniref:STAS domain-containing protein n=2 Tax=Streptomyces polyasparticus TaxID=2767826 RepID=A0ABR7SI46_9ACTN|nr:STAS domain-containing protein [Streptomyces polyasparticus]
MCPDLFEECRLVRARGELDLTTVDSFAQALRASRATAGSPFLLVDLSLVSFMDGSVLAPLDESWADCERRRGWVRVVYLHRTGLVFRASGDEARFPRYANCRNAWQGLAA